MHAPRRRALAVCTVLAAAATALAPAAVAADGGAGAAAASQLAARTAVHCSDGRLQLILENRSDSARTFTVTGPDGDHRYTREVPAGGSGQLEWTRPAGAHYTLETTAPGGFRRTESGTVDCGLAQGTPQLNTTRLFGTDTVFRGLLGADGKEYDGTARSVRIPAMAVTNDGTILAAADARVDGSSDLPANIQVGLRRSTDNGATWSEPRIVAHAGSTDSGTGDSSLLVDRETGRVFLFYNHGRPGTGFFEENPADGGQRLMYMTSDDDGATWSEPVDVTPQVRQPDWKNQFASSGHGIQTDTGRLLQPVVHRDTKGTTRTGNLVSDDHGKTWRAGAAAGTDVNESKAVQRSTGEIVQNMRHNSGGARYYATSPDGEGPFTAMTRAAALPDPGNNGDEISFLEPAAGTPGRTRTALFSNTATTSGRNELTLRLSEDDGASWPRQAVVKSGPAGYSTLAVLRDGTIGDLYEVGDTGGIHFARLSRDHLD
ncbi:exo-alpha-sialidase [Streptomyces sp. NHF165]|uniref:exo-alpha-sialidase n=1 Tax=Streptomyces sp. NHF165 TaxID=2175864 RepID=UPI00135B3E44|nr:exo-alpha-sialidase [Streptomyces sp. NHF165]